MLSLTEKEQQILENNSELAERKNPKVDYKGVVCKKPWGYEFLVYESEKIGIWFLNIEKGNQTSLHTHFHKDSFIIVLEGCAKISTIDTVSVLHKLESIFIPKYKFHGLSSFSDSVFLLEIEIVDDKTNFSDKNDLLRIHDSYKRTSTGYESSVQIIKENIEQFNHFMFSKGFQTELFNTSIKVGELTKEAKSANYVILLEGTVYQNGFYCKEGSNLKSLLGPEKMYCSENLCLTIENKFCHEDSKIIYCPEQLEIITEVLKGKKKKIIMTSGCFDILHVGHLKHLQEAKKQGDILMVCLSSDAQIKTLKGPERPINNLEDRLNLFKTIDYVDYIILYDEVNSVTEETLGSLMKIVDRDIWTKGTDYKPQDILVKHPYLRKVVCLENVKGKSTTNLVQKIKA